MSNRVINTNTHLDFDPIISIDKGLETYHLDNVSWKEALLKQQAAVNVYWVPVENSVWNSLSYHGSVALHKEISDDEKIDMVEVATAYIKSDVHDIDADIRQFVTDNFDDLLWK